MARNLKLKLTPAQHDALLSAIDYWTTICEDEISTSDEIARRNQYIGSKRS